MSAPVLEKISGPWWLTARAGFEDGDDFLRQGIPKKTG